MSSKTTGLPPDTLRKQFLDSFGAIKSFLRYVINLEDTTLTINIASNPTIRKATDADILLHDIGTTVEDVLFGSCAPRMKCIRLRILQLGLSAYEEVFYKFFPSNEFRSTKPISRLFEDLSQTIDDFRIWYTIWLTPEDHEYAMVEELVALAQDKDTEPMCTPIDERCDPLEGFMSIRPSRQRTAAVDVAVDDCKQVAKQYLSSAWGKHVSLTDC